MGALKVCETALGVTVDQQTLESTTKLVMIFEYFHPEVGFILGTEKLAFLLRILMRLEEDISFIIFHNVYFDSEYLWSVLTADQPVISLNLQALKGLVSRLTDYSEMYKINRLQFERFFVENSL